MLKQFCTPVEYQMAQEYLADSKASLAKAKSAPEGSIYHRGIAHFEKCVRMAEDFLASHEPQEGYVPADRSYVGSISTDPESGVPIYEVAEK